MILEMPEFQKRVRDSLSSGNRLISFFGSPTGEPDAIHLNAVIAQKLSAHLELLRTVRKRGGSYRSLTPDFPQLHCFERKCFEQFDIKPIEHP